MRLRSRVFVGGTILMTALVVIGIVAASLLAGRTTPVRVGFNDGSQALEPTFTATAVALGANVTISDIADVAAGQAQVTAGTLDVLVTGSATAPTAVAKAAVPPNVESALSLAAEAARLSEAGLSPAAITSAMALVPIQLLQPPNAKDTQNLLASLALGILLWIALGQYGNMVAQGVVEEKATRIMEILLATIQPTRLLAGKVIGIGLVGLLQLTVVGAAALVAVQVTHVATIPALGVASILADIFWFLIGFLFYATAYSAVASLVSRQEEVQSAVAPISILQIAGYLLMYAALPNPIGPPGDDHLVAPAVHPDRHGGADGGQRRAVLAGRPGSRADRGIHRRPDLASRPDVQQRRAPPRRADPLHGGIPWVVLAVGPTCSGPVGPRRSKEESDAASCESPSVLDPDGGGLRDPHPLRPGQQRHVVGRLGLCRRGRRARGCWRSLRPRDQALIRRSQALPHPLPLLVAIIAAVVIVYGRVSRRWPIAIFGFALLALAALLVVIGSGTQ